MKVSVYIDQVLFSQALRGAKDSGLTPSQKTAHWAAMGQFMETKSLGSLRLIQSGQKNK
ncbi:conserved hypothetical protein [Vibrio chagasii]|nr:conserved hypothetical protein [Vibrio chagasii]CAH7177986.1 conserved hypothetical protein [Vibrio chagasii]CAH7218530.1 conserved hypothetical protein [Vibrio chagasii]CAH7346567.1 conserved hypothetical protein [Vibrio chagasii]CAH7386519.1 conserved hypothetical protein [Vibrio chagasii]